MFTSQQSTSVSSNSTTVSPGPSSVSTGPPTALIPETPHASLTSHEKRLSVALEALLNHNIPVMEYGSQILYRWGWAEVLLTVEWAVPDELLAFASRVLTESGFPWTPVPKRYNPILGGWEDLCEHHIRDAAGKYYIRLYGLSTLGLTLNDTFEVRSTFDPSLRLLTPKPPRYMLSMIQHLLNLPLQHPRRPRVIDDLAGFIEGFIFRGAPANTQYYGEEDWAALEREFLEKVPSAVEYIKSWDWGYVPDKGYLDVAEAIVRDAKKLRTVTNMS
ncbi:uncharacterized protein BDW43DRAFT_321107 [Aspergillus alliaceus]|uniref:uncharacterized protein n=1 Tax=Petromyces alliaceus TaxID=209559 RepID=UPI0012A72402|nr:uncharacterized protein BDW43DRAFT_321107 [Aspergillus alliaceus]KAB8237917.1 hypothetical protein BDW43DRAFT_321107 [Aspergillus alliaceus]